MNRRIIPVVVVVVLLAGCADSPETLRDKGIEHFQAGRAAQAKPLLEQALYLRPSDPAALFFRGRVAYNEGQLGMARYYFECCLDADPAYAKAHKWLERVRTERGRISPLDSGGPR